MTYRELARKISNEFTEQQLDSELVIYDADADLFFDVARIDMDRFLILHKENDIVSSNYPCFVINYYSY